MIFSKRLQNEYERAHRFTDRLGLERPTIEDWYIHKRSRLRPDQVRHKLRTISPPEIDPHTIPSNYWKKLLYRANAGARKRNLKFTLTETQLDKLVKRSRGICAVSGHPFSLEWVSTSHRRPFAPSLDRINCAKGYTYQNVRLVCVAVNIALGDWGAEVFQKLANSATKPLRKSKVTR